MQLFFIETENGQRIRFEGYFELASRTCAAFLANLPFQQTFLHARVSGQEIWTDDAPGLDIPQENASVFTSPGEVVVGPLFPERNKIRRCIGIFYGPGQLLDCGNIFGRVCAEDMELLEILGEEIWRRGGQVLRFDNVET